MILFDKWWTLVCMRLCVRLFSSHFVTANEQRRGGGRFRDIREASEKRHAKILSRPKSATHALTYAITNTQSKTHHYL